MAENLIAGAALGAPFSELLKAVIAVAKKTAKFKSILKRLEDTLNSLQPIVHEIDTLDKQLLDRSNEETNVFMGQLEEGKTLIQKCASIHCWDLCSKFRYSNKLLKLESTILGFFGVKAQAQLGSISRKTLVGVQNVECKTDQILSIVENRVRVSGLCSVPELPRLLIGLDVQVAELKGMLLKDDVSVVVISAPGGCGKTTLAKMVCHDKEIRDLFGDNIFYVTVSQKANLRVIAKRLFEHRCPEWKSEFRTDEEAKNQLESLMKQIQSDHILLVLDDAWSGSESLIQALKFQIPGYKILVTSRFVFKRFESTYRMKLLNDEDANILFRDSAFPRDGIPNVPADLVNKIVQGCKGFPLALTVIGASLSGQPVLKWRSTLKKWSEGQSIFDSSSDLLFGLQTSIDALDEFPELKECYLDLGLFPEDQRIAATTLMDMWVELYELDEEGLYTFENLLELSVRNLVNLITLREDAKEVEGYCNEHCVMQHDLLRELAIHQTSQEPIEQRKRLIIDISRNDLPTWWMEQAERPLQARLLSIATDETFSSRWYDMRLPKVEVLILNLRSASYALPDFMERLQQLKVLIITNYGFCFAELQNFLQMGYLSNLRRMRFERVSVSPLDKSLELRNLQKLSLIMCKIGKAFESCSSDIPYMLPNLLEFEIDRCDDLRKLPEGLCKLIHLKKLSITYCHELDELPEEFGSLENLEVLRLNSCTNLVGLPESVGNLRKLCFLDICDCLSISKLPSGFSELTGLRILRMSGCQSLQELPTSVNSLRQLEEVICDEETSYLWRNYESDLSDLKIDVIQENILANLMKVIATSKLLDS